MSADAKYQPSDPQAAVVAWLKERTLFHIRYTRGKDWHMATPYDQFLSFARAVRDLAVDRFIATQGAYAEENVKRAHYFSMEFLVGKLLASNLLALGIHDAAVKALKELGVEIQTMYDQEEEAGLGNGGLGRLAACYLDSMATLGLPGYGYGLRYEHGIFEQHIINGWQQEQPDNWLSLAYPWEMARPEYTTPVLVYGRMENVHNPARGCDEQVWVDWQMFEGVPYDVPIIGFHNNTVNMLRLWSSRAAKTFALDVFNRGDYVRAVEEKNWAENVTKVLYPSDNNNAGRELRLIQEYFLVTCSVRDIIRRYKKNHKGWEHFAQKNAIQLNDTHPALTVAELMRYFVDDTDVGWERAWDITTETISYTNHTLLPEALEKWPVDLLGRVLPRHLQVIYDINARFLQKVELSYPGDVERARDLSIVEETPVKQVRMANLAVVGSHVVNGVSALHSDLLKTRVLREFAVHMPEKFINVTNGVTPRRWLLQCNPGLAALISEAIGDRWVTDLDQLHKLEPLAEDAEFRRKFLAVKRDNKRRLARLIDERTGLDVFVESLFDVQIKRLHMYKRQLLNVLHIVHLYRRIKQDPSREFVPRTFIFGAKAAPSYSMAKLVIKLIHTIGAVINHDADVAGRIKVVFAPNYNVTLAERLVPAADLSEQISTAGYEASGTGNMKLALNGALTIGTWDGANIEIAGQVGEKNIFVFGNRVEQIADLRARGYHPSDCIAGDQDLRAVIDMIRNNEFMPSEPGLFRDLIKDLVDYGDTFMVLADFRMYVDCQEQVSQLYRQPAQWARTAILNVARMGFFSSDRAVHEYAEKIWKIRPVAIRMPEGPVTP